MSITRQKYRLNTVVQTTHNRLTVIKFYQCDPARTWLLEFELVKIGHRPFPMILRAPYHPSWLTVGLSFRQFRPNFKAIVNLLAWLASQGKSCDLVEIKVKHHLGNVGILDKPELHAYRLSKFLRISLNNFLSISKYISLHIILYLTNSATDHPSKFKLQPIGLPTQLHDRDSVYAHQLYLNCIRVTFIRLFQLPTIYHHLILLYRCFCF